MQFRLQFEGGGSAVERVPDGRFRPGDAERGGDRGQVLKRRRLIAGNTDLVCADEAQVHAVGLRCGNNVRRTAGSLDRDGVEEALTRQFEAAASQHRGECPGGVVSVGGDSTQALGTVVDRIHAGDNGQQSLRGADVGGRLLAADVLFAGLQRQAEGGGAGVVLGNSDDTAGKRTLQALADGHVGGVRATEEQRNTHALGGADGDVGTLLARSGDQGQREQVCRNGNHRAAFLRRGDDGGVVVDPA